MCSAASTVDFDWLSDTGLASMASSGCMSSKTAGSPSSVLELRVAAFVTAGCPNNGDDDDDDDDDNLDEVCVCSAGS